MHICRIRIIVMPWGNGVNGQTIKLNTLSVMGIKIKISNLLFKINLQKKKKM